MTITYIIVIVLLMLLLFLLAVNQMALAKNLGKLKNDVGGIDRATSDGFLDVEAEFTKLKKKIELCDLFRRSHLDYHNEIATKAKTSKRKSK